MKKTALAYQQNLQHYISLLLNIVTHGMWRKI